MNPKKKPAKHSISDSEVLRNIIIESIRHKKGEVIVSLNLKKIREAVTNYFIVCEASSSVQVKAIAEQVLKSVNENAINTPSHVEGLKNMEWVLIDFFDIVVHIFLKETRALYRLELLWSDADLENYDDVK